MEINKNDPTFSTYNSSQATAYAIGRGSYQPALFEFILKHHAATGGKFDQLLDVGCGPGNATRSISANFQHAVGTDFGVEMINTARKLGGTAAQGPVQFEVVSAEKCDQVPGVGRGSVDLLIAAMAAHWFEMPEFWRNAAKVVKSGGTVALWTVSSLYCHPRAPNAAKVQEILFDLERNILAPFELPHNRISRDMYDNLVLPWQCDPIEAAFPQAGFTRKDWNRDGKLAPDEEDFLIGNGDESLEDFEKSMQTASMVTRWRQAHPDLVGTDQDCVKLTTSRLREALGDSENLRTGGATALLLFKRR